MKKRKLPVVNETTKYDDLVAASPKTKKLMEKRRTLPRAKPKASSKKVKKKAPVALPIVKVKIASQSAANEFATLIQQNLNADQTNIVFSGVKKATKRSFSFRAATPKQKEQKEQSKLAKRKKKQEEVHWNTDDFFNRHWVDMPPFENEEFSSFVTFKVSFPTIAAHKVWLMLTGETKNSFTFGETKKQGTKKANLRWVGVSSTNKLRYPIYIISKGRAHYGPLTAKVLHRLGVPFYLMVEPHEYHRYKTLCDFAEDVLVLPESNHGMGPGRARNACWDHAKNVLKAKRHWVLDDNIADFYRLNENKRIRVSDGTIFRAAEDFVDRYTNVAVAGFAYKFFHVAKSKQYPFKLNTRIYSCLLIDNDCPYRWRGRYNEDTILSLDVLKDHKKHKTHLELNAKNDDGSFKTSRRERLTTVEFVAFLQDKLNTQVQKGGNTKEFYSSEGTAAKSMMLAETHPDVAKTEDMFGRAHHKADYTLFRENWLIRSEKRKSHLKKHGWKATLGNNPYGMKLVEKKN